MTNPSTTPTTPTTPTSDDVTYVRISKRELLNYIAQAQQLAIITRENEELRSKLLSSNIVQPSTTSDLPLSAAQGSPIPLGPVLMEPEQNKSINTSPSSSLATQPTEPIALINSALAAFPPPPVITTAYDENGRIIQKEITSSSVNYASIIETVTNLIKLKDQEARLRASSDPTLPLPPQLYLPYLMTPENTRIIMNAVELGVTRYRACGLTGISKHTYNDWRNKAADQLEPYASFFALFELAEARTEAALVHAWREHVRDGWQAADGFLKKRFRNEWGEKQQISLSRADISNLPTAQLEEALGPEAISALTDTDTDDTTDNDNVTDTTDYEVIDDL